MPPTNESESAGLLASSYRSDSISTSSGGSSSSGSRSPSPSPSPLPSSEPRTCLQRLRDALSIVPAGATPLPSTPIAMATFAIFNCVLHMTLLFPFVPQMLRTFDVAEQDIGRFNTCLA